MFMQFEIASSDDAARRKAKEYASGLKKSVSGLFAQIVDEMKQAW